MQHIKWINYHHLLYFWTAAKEGSIARAYEKLTLAQPTISGQLQLLEEALGEKLFTRLGRGLVMTEVGRGGLPLRLFVGISDMVPQLIAHRVLQPALAVSLSVHLICEESSHEHLLVDLAEHRLDVVLCDTPV